MSLFFHRVEKSALFTFLGIVLLFSTAVIVTLLAPNTIDPTWTTPFSSYQRQMYEVADPHIYIGTSKKHAAELVQLLYLEKGKTLVGFRESESQQIEVPASLEQYVVRDPRGNLVLSSRLLLLREKAPSKAVGREQSGGKRYELFEASGSRALALNPTDTPIESWASSNFSLAEGEEAPSYWTDEGVLYFLNPIVWEEGEALLAEQGNISLAGGAEVAKALEKHSLRFVSRERLIEAGEALFAAEGCWYCHTDQTRTLIQDTVLNGSPDYPAPPSAAGEYVYQKITFPGTRRIGPDLSRVAIRHPERDWHMGHFWSPKTASRGSIMPAFQHFFDSDPRGTVPWGTGIPNEQFEAIYQYLMTKGSRLYSPQEAWWEGKDPIQTKKLIEQGADR